MTISVTCPDCQTTQTVGNEKAGMRLRCKQCGAIVPIAVSAPQIPDSPLPTSVTAKNIRPRRGFPKIGTFVYGCVGVLLVFVVSVRLWFDPPTFKLAGQKSISNPNVLTANSISPHTTTSPPLSERVRSVLAEAMTEKMRTDSSRFVPLLQSVANDLPEIQLSTEPGTVIWNKFQLYEQGMMLNAFRFTSPLDVEGDFYWCFVSTRSVGAWYIHPASGGMEGFSEFLIAPELQLEGVDLPPTEDICVQQLIGGRIKPRESYIVYFSSDLMIPMPLRVAARVVPASESLDHEIRLDRLLRKIGIKQKTVIPPPPDSRVLDGHTESFVHVAWKPNGLLVAFDSAGDVFRWDAVRGTQISKDPTGQRLVNATVSANGKQAVLLSQTPSRVAVWNLDTSQTTATMPAHPGTPVHALFAPDGNSVYVAYRLNTSAEPSQCGIVQWSLQEPQLLANHEIENFDIRGLQTSAQGLRVVGGMGPQPTSSIPAIADWPADLSTAPDPVTSQGNLIMGTCNVRNGKLELTIDYHGIIRINDPEADHKTVYSCAVPIRLISVCCLADDRFVAISGDDNRIHVFDTVERQICATWAEHDDLIVNLALSSDGKTLASSSKDGTIRLWNARTERYVPRQFPSLVDSEGHELKPIPATEFLMGTSTGFNYDRTYRQMADFLVVERPQHRVQITRPYYLASHEVTIGQFRRFVEATGYKTTGEKYGKGGLQFTRAQMKWEQSPKYTWRNVNYETTDNCPVVHVSWQDAQAYCEWLSKIERAKYRLPTEAEWEFACGAKLIGQRNFVAEDEIYPLCCNVADQSLRDQFGGDFPLAAPWGDGHPFAAEVGTFLPNKFGLSEMLGNVWELCQDSWTEYAVPNPPDSIAIDPLGKGDTAHVARGSSFYGHQYDARSARRDHVNGEENQSDLGFRVLREIP